MSMLNRFRKPGGFLQLLALIENSEPEKRTSLLTMVAKEDPGWAHLAKTKALTFDRVLTWPTEVLELIAEKTPLEIHTVILTGLKSETRTKWFKSLPSEFQKRTRSFLSHEVMAGLEYHVASLKVVKIVRDMAENGELQFQSFDPSLYLDKRLAA